MLPWVVMKIQCKNTNLLSESAGSGEHWRKGAVVASGCGYPHALGPAESSGPAPARNRSAQRYMELNNWRLPGSPFGKGMEGIFNDLSGQDLWVMIQPQWTVKFSHSSVESH